MKKIIFLFTTFILFFTFVGCQNNSTTKTNSYENPDSDLCQVGAKDDVYLCRKTYTSYFDTTISLTLYITKDDIVDIHSIFEVTEETLLTYHQLMDKYHAYEGVNNVYTINHNGLNATIISDELYQTIAFGLDYENSITENQEELFNIALGPVLDIWHNARESSSCDTDSNIAYSICPVPNNLIDQQTFPTDPSKIQLNSDQSSITFMEEGMSIDLGGYGKGYVSEILADYYDEQGITYLLNVGNSNVKAGGINPNNDDGYFYIALTKPQIEFSLGNSYFAYLKVPEDISVVTSGTYQRFFVGEEDQLVYHHIIDPRTNYPGGEVMSVTIFFEDGGLADIYSTSIFLMTLEDALLYVNQTEGLEAIWYVEDGNIVSSNGFNQYLYKMIETS